MRSWALARPARAWQDAVDGRTTEEERPGIRNACSTPRRRACLQTRNERRPHETRLEFARRGCHPGHGPARCDGRGRPREKDSGVRRERSLRLLEDRRGGPGEGAGRTAEI